MPSLPPILPLPYEHVNTRYEINPPYQKVKQTLACMHALDTYIWLIEQTAGGTDPLDPGCVGP